VSVAGANISFPSIGVNASGSGVMTFSLMGPNDFPSHAYTPISLAGTMPNRNTMSAPPAPIGPAKAKPAASAASVTMAIAGK